MGEAVVLTPSGADIRNAIEIPIGWGIAIQPNGACLVFPPQTVTWDELLPITRAIHEIDKKHK